MKSVKEKALTLGIALLVAILSYAFLFLVFSPSLRSQKEDLREKREALYLAETLLSRKEELEKEWERKKSTFPQGFSSEETLNLWVKELLSFASSEGITFSRMEPQGMKEKEEGRELRLSLSFQGDIRKLIHFLYYLLGKDPLSRIESFSIKQEEETKSFTYELLLGKPLL